MVTDRAAWRQTIEQRIAAVARDLEQRLSWQPWCEIHKDGRVTGGMKYDEGRLVVLQAARAWVDGDLPQRLDQELTRWRARLINATSVPWRAYYQGVVDALAELRDGV